MTNVQFTQIPALPALRRLVETNFGLYTEPGQPLYRNRGVEEAFDSAMTGLFVPPSLSHEISYTALSSPIRLETYAGNSESFEQSIFISALAEHANHVGGLLNTDGSQPTWEEEDALSCSPDFEAALRVTITPKDEQFFVDAFMRIEERAEWIGEQCLAAAPKRFHRR